MVCTTNRGLLIEIETTSPYEQLYYLQQSILQLLKDASSEYTEAYDARPAVFELLNSLAPDTTQLAQGL